MLSFYELVQFLKNYIILEKLEILIMIYLYIAKKWPYKQRYKYKNINKNVFINIYKQLNIDKNHKIFINKIKKLKF